MRVRGTIRNREPSWRQVRWRFADLPDRSPCIAGSRFRAPIHLPEFAMSLLRKENVSRRAGEQQRFESPSSAPQNSQRDQFRFPQLALSAEHGNSDPPRTTTGHPSPNITLPSANTTSFRHPGGRASDWRGVERERHPGYASQNGSGPRRGSQLPGWNRACCQIMPFPQPLLHAFRHPGRPPRNRQ